MGMMWCRRILPRRAVGRPDSSRRRLRRVQVPLHHHADAHLTGSSGSTATTSGWPGSRFETRDPRRRLLQTSYVPCQGTTFSRAEKSAFGGQRSETHPYPPTPPGGGLVSPYSSGSIRYRESGITLRVAGYRLQGGQTPPGREPSLMVRSKSPPRTAPDGRVSSANRKALFGPVNHRADKAFLILRLGSFAACCKGNRKGARYEGHEAWEAKATRVKVPGWRPTGHYDKQGPLRGTYAFIPQEEGSLLGQSCARRAQSS
jgi:hypothetical protein